MVDNGLLILSNATICLLELRRQHLWEGQDHLPFNDQVFFNNLIKFMDRFNFTPETVFTIDETGCSTVHKPGRMVALKGVKQVGSSW